MESFTTWILPSIFDCFKLNSWNKSSASSFSLMMLLDLPSNFSNFAFSSDKSLMLDLVSLTKISSSFLCFKFVSTIWAYSLLCSSCSPIFSSYSFLAGSIDFSDIGCPQVGQGWPMLLSSAFLSSLNPSILLLQTSIFNLRLLVLESKLLISLKHLFNVLFLLEISFFISCNANFSSSISFIIFFLASNVSEACLSSSAHFLSDSFKLEDSVFKSAMSFRYLSSFSLSNLIFSSWELLYSLDVISASEICSLSFSILSSLSAILHSSVLIDVSTSLSLDFVISKHLENTSKPNILSKVLFISASVAEVNLNDSAVYRIEDVNVT